MDETMKSRVPILPVLLSALLFTIALAAPVAVSGAIKTNLAQTTNLRVGVFLTDRSGNPSLEIASSAVQGSNFALSIPDAAPPASSLVPVVSDNLDWPFLVGKITVTGSARIDRAMLRAYRDNDRSNSNSNSDTNLETIVTRGRGNLVLVYSDAKFRVQGDKGFDITLESGWNLLSITPGSTIDTKRVPSLDGLQLEVFGK